MFSSNSSQVSNAAVFVEDVMSTYLYTGNGSTQTITNNIDLSTYGGLVWIKDRTQAFANALFDTTRGAGNVIRSNGTNANFYDAATLTAFNSNGFSVGTDSLGWVNTVSDNYASWTFRKQPKFFDVVTYTGTGSNTTIAHALGAVPGSIIVKRTDTTGAWQVYHRSLANTEYLVLNTTAATATGTTRWNSTTPTSTVFSLGTDASVNASGGTYVAYIYAHDSGGFGLTGTDNVISCGSFTTDGSGNATVNLGYEPQFWLYKPTIAARYWTIYDVMRGWSQTQIANLNPNVADAEGGGAATAFYPTATGFDCVGGNLDPSTQHIYIAIRRGPMKVPTLGTSVFYPYAASAPGNAVVTTGFPVDLQIQKNAGAGTDPRLVDRLRGVSSTPTSPSAAFPFLVSSDTSAESTGTGTTLDWGNTGFTVGNTYAGSAKAWAVNFRRAPSFFDEVCYTGTGSARTVAHNLTVAPELMIVKSRTPAGNDWMTYVAPLGNQAYLQLNRTYVATTSDPIWNNTTPTSSVFSVGVAGDVNGSGNTQVAYLFATLAGVSKVGSYTGNGSTQTINCGFTSGARFVLIKRTDATGGWYVYDTARGMTVLTDPYLFLNSTAAEVATLGSVTTVSTGFALDSSILAAINVSAASYIFLSVA